MSRAAWISTTLFGVLLVLFVATREERVSVGIRTLDWAEIDPESVTAIELSGDRAVQLVRQGETWTLRDPATPERELAADAAMVRAALEALAAPDAGRFVTARPGRHAELEVDEETGTVVTVSGAGDEQAELVVGRSAKNGGTFLRLRTDDEVYVGAGTLGRALRKEFDEWRRRELIAAAADEFEAFTASRGNSILLDMTSASPAGEGGEGVEWKMASTSELPDGFRLDSSAAARTVGAFAGLRAAEFIDEDPGADRTGLDEFALWVRGRLSAGDTIGVRFGSEAGDERVYARVDGEDQLYLVAKRSMTPFMTGIEPLRDLAPFRFEADAVTRVAFRHAGGGAVLERDANGSWSIIEPSTLPPGYELDALAVSTQLRQLSNLRAQRVIGPLDGETGNFSDPVEVEIGLRSGESRTLVLGAEVPGLGSGPASDVFVKSDDGLLYAVRKIQKTRYTTPLDLFRHIEPPPSMGGVPGSPQGLDQLPPELRRQIEEAMRNQQGAGSR